MDFHHLIPHFYLAADTCSNGIFGPGTPGLYDGLCNGSSPELGSVDKIIVLISNLVRILLALSGALGVLFLVVAGIFYVTSAGDPSRLKRAKEIITNVVTGLIIIIIAYAVVTFISDRLT